jgi:DNA repair exonuclease SbcCD ATPase subunit
MTTTQTKNSYFTPARDDVEGDIRKAEENLSDLVARLTERMHNMDADRDEDGDPTNERYTAIEEAIEELEAVARSLDSAADTLAEVSQTW